MAPRHRSSFDSFSSGESSRRSNTPRRNEDASRPQASAARSYSRAAYGDTGTRQRAASFSRDSTQAEYARIRAKKKRRKIIGGVVGDHGGHDDAVGQFQGAELDGGENLFKVVSIVMGFLRLPNRSPSSGALLY